MTSIEAERISTSRPGPPDVLPAIQEVDPPDRSMDRPSAIRVIAPNAFQTAVLTSRWDLREMVVAYRRCERWRQENVSKYMRRGYLIDALTDHAVKPDDPRCSVPDPARRVRNPARKVVDQALHYPRPQLAGLRQSYGATAPMTWTAARRRCKPPPTPARLRNAVAASSTHSRGMCSTPFSPSTMKVNDQAGRPSPSAQWQVGLPQRVWLSTREPGNKSSGRA